VLTSMLMYGRLVCPRHPENAFFEQFANSLIYDNAEQFSQQLALALAHDPPPLTDDDHRCDYFRAHDLSRVMQSGTQQRSIVCSSQVLQSSIAAEP